MSYKKVVSSLVAVALLSSCSDSDVPAEKQEETSPAIAAVDTQRIMDS